MGSYTGAIGILEEVKTLRRVRTPAGVIKYGLPINSIIVPGAPETADVTLPTAIADIPVAVPTVPVKRVEVVHRPDGTVAVQAIHRRQGFTQAVFPSLAGADDWIDEVLDGNENIAGIDHKVRDVPYTLEHDGTLLEEGERIGAIKKRGGVYSYTGDDGEKHRAGSLNEILHQLRELHYESEEPVVPATPKSRPLRGMGTSQLDRNATGMFGTENQANAEAEKAERERSRLAALSHANRLALKPGDRVDTEWGPATVTKHTSRTISFDTDGGDSLNVVVGTPGYSRINPSTTAPPKIESILDDPLLDDTLKPGKRDVNGTEVIVRGGPDNFTVSVGRRKIGHLSGGNGYAWTAEPWEDSEGVWDDEPNLDVALRYLVDQAENFRALQTEKREERRRRIADPTTSNLKKGSTFDPKDPKQLKHAKDQDALLFKLIEDRGRIDRDVQRAQTSIYNYAGIRRQYGWGRGQRNGYYTVKPDDAEQQLRTMLRDAKVPAWDVKNAVQALDELEKAKRERDASDRAGEALEREYDKAPWPRFFYADTKGRGHIHRSMRCSTCRPTTRFIPVWDLSGSNEAQAVKEHGAILCTVCYPSAPVIQTNGKAKAIPEMKDYRDR